MYLTENFSYFQNLLFYYDSEACNRPSGVVFLEGCYCERIITTTGCTKKDMHDRQVIWIYIRCEFAKGLRYLLRGRWAYAELSWYIRQCLTNSWQLEICFKFDVSFFLRHFLVYIASWILLCNEILCNLGE